MNHEKSITLLVVALLIGNLTQVVAQSVERIRSGLIQSGFENIRISQSESTFMVCLENKSFRWQVAAICESLDLISRELDTPANIELLLLDNTIPKLMIQVNSEDWKNFRNKLMDVQDFSSQIRITSSTGELWQSLKGLEAANQSAGKIDLVLYPQFAFKNTLLRKPYEIQLNLAPAVELMIPGGLKFTGQLIVPLINEFGYEGDFVRPGYVTISQELRIRERWLARWSAGNFSETRYGADLAWKHVFRNENWTWQTNLSYTGSSHFFDYKWTKSPLNTFSGASSLSYYYPNYQLEFKGGAARYIYEDFGLFASCTRYFGETAFGFYAMLGEHDVNGGFHVSVPLPFKKRSARKNLRVTLPEHYEMTYNAGTEFLYGQSFRTRPDQNRIHDNLNPEYIKSNLIHLNK